MIGEISIGKDFAEAMMSSDSSTSKEAAVLSGEERKKVREQRVQKLAEILIHKLSIYTDNPTLEALKYFEDIITSEAEDLKNESYGVELLHAIGYCYSNRAKQFLSRNDLLGIPNWFQSVAEKTHIFSETISTFRTAIDMQATLTKLQTADEKGMDEKEKAVLEEQVAFKGLNAIWKGSKLEVESVIRDVCDVVLSRGEKDVLLLRANALKTVGKIYSTVVGKEGGKFGGAFARGSNGN